MQLWYIAHVRQDQSDAPLISFSVSEQSIPLFSSILLTENLLCVCVCAHMGSTACVRARTHTPVGSSTDDCFDVYFTAVAENRWLLGAAARCQSESKCNSVYRSVCGLMWACVCTAVTLRLHPHVFIDCVRELLSVYVNEVPFKHGRLSSNTFSSPTCSTWVELCAARTVHSQQGKTEVRWMSCWAAPVWSEGKTWNSCLMFVSVSQISKLWTSFKLPLENVSDPVTPEFVQGQEWACWCCPTGVKCLLRYQQIHKTPEDQLFSVTAQLIL